MSTTYATTRSGQREMDRANADKARAEAATAHAGAATAQAEAAKAGLEVERQRALMQQELRREEAETRKAEQAQKAREDKLKADAKAAKKAARREALGEKRALIVTDALIGVSMAIAWPAQAAYFMHAGMGWLGLAAPIVIEGPTWLSAILTARAVEKGGATWLFQLTTLAFAGIAATINYAHGAEHNNLLGVLYALASLVGVLSWELYVLSAKQHKAGRTAAERRRDMLRRVSYPRLWRKAVRLRRASTGMDAETAWTLAWRMKHGTDPGLTARSLTEMNNAMESVMFAAESQSVVTIPGAQLLGVRTARTGLGMDTLAGPGRSLPAPQPGRTDKPAAGARKGSVKAVQGGSSSQVTSRIPQGEGARKGGRRQPLSRGARAAASATARKAVDPHEAEQEKIRAAQRWNAAKRAGEALTYAQLAEEFGYSESWAYKAVKSHGALHVAAA